MEGMRRNPRIDRSARLVNNLLDRPAAHGEPAPTAPQIRAALHDLQRGTGRQRGRRSARR
jgi:hypothetical protein